MKLLKKMQYSGDLNNLTTKYERIFPKIRCLHTKAYLGIFLTITKSYFQLPVCKYETGTSPLAVYSSRTVYVCNFQKWNTFKQAYVSILKFTYAFIKYKNTFLQNTTQSKITNTYLKNTNTNLNTTSKRANMLIFAYNPFVHA